MSGKKVGIIGKIHPNTCEDDIYVAEINLDILLSIRTGRIKYKEVNKYPNIKKDFAVIVDKNVLSSDLIKTIKKSGGKYLNNVEVFDVYVGSNI